MAVANVPAAHLAPLGDGLKITSGDPITKLLTATALSDHVLSVLIQNGTHVKDGFLHVASMGQNGGPVKGACDSQ